MIAEEELADAKRQMTAEAYAQEYECSFDAAIRGSYYGKDVEEAEAAGRIGRVPYDKAADVYCSWDLGIGDMMSLWFFQIIGKEWHFLRYYENNGFGLDHYVDYVKSLPYRVHEHLLPHDAEARELQTGNSRIQFLEGRGLSCRVVARHNVDDGINAVRVKFNRFHFDREGCARGLDCLRMYRSEFDDKHQILRPRPLHDWASHGADSFRTGIMGAEEAKPEVYIPKRKFVAV